MDQKRVYGSRARRLAGELGKAGLRGVIVVPGPNLRYLTGVQSLLMERPFILLLPAEGTPSLIAPRLEAGPYRDGPLDLHVHDWTDSQGPLSAIGEAVKDVGVSGRWGVEGRAPFLFLHSMLKRADPHLEDAEPILQGIREVKDELEVRTMKRAAKILSDSFGRFPALIRQGISESELARKVSDTIYAHGGTKVDDVLVQSGPHASVPHSLPTARKIRAGESIVIDIGSTFEGYYADITRTFCLGKSKEVERVYAEVLAAEEKAIAAAGAGVTVGKVDAAARRHLEKAGLGSYFIHRTGHGLGLEVHEAPYIVQGGREVLGKNMFFTVEPGAYIPGKLGVRIEDDVMIAGKRATEITDPPKEYGWWR